MRSKTDQIVAQNSLGTLSPCSYYAAQEMVMAMADYSNSLGRTILGKNKTQKHYEKSIAKFTDFVLAMFVDERITKLMPDEEVLEEAKSLIYIFEIAHPNWQEAYQFFHYFTSNPPYLQQAINAIDRARAQYIYNLRSNQKGHTKETKNPIKSAISKISRLFYAFLRLVILLFICIVILEMCTQKSNQNNSSIGSPQQQSLGPNANRPANGHAKSVAPNPFDEFDGQDNTGNPFAVFAKKPQQP